MIEIGGISLGLAFINKKFLQLHLGNGMISGHVDAVHAKPPEADRFTDIITKGLIEQTGCAGIISTVSRVIADLNRDADGSNDEALKEYRESIQDILLHLGTLNEKKMELKKPYLHLSFHGMKDVHHGPYAMEIGTVHGNACSFEIRNWLNELIAEKLKVFSPGVQFVFDHKFAGDPSIVFHRKGNGKDYKGYGDNYNAFQVEISRTLRENHSTLIIKLFSKVITQFQDRFIFPPLS
jgi:hypothetical protein